MTKTPSYALDVQIRQRGEGEQRKSVLVFTRIDTGLYKAYRKARRSHIRTPGCTAPIAPGGGG